MRNIVRLGVRNEVRKLTGRNQQRREHYIAEHTRQESKHFRNCVNSKLKTKMGVPDLFKSANQKTITAGDTEKAEVLSELFGSVFTRKSIQILPIT